MAASLVPEVNLGQSSSPQPLPDWFTDRPNDTTELENELVEDFFELRDECFSEMGYRPLKGSEARTYAERVKRWGYGGPHASFFSRIMRNLMDWYMAEMQPKEQEAKSNDTADTRGRFPAG